LRVYEKVSFFLVYTEELGGPPYPPRVSELVSLTNRVPLSLSSSNLRDAGTT